MMNFSLKKIYLLCLLLSTISMSVQAVHICSGKVKEIDLSGNGGILGKIEGMKGGMRFCSLNEQVGVYTPESCKAMYAALLAAQASGKEVTLWFNDDSDTSCVKPSWTTLATYGFYHFRINQ